MDELIGTWHAFAEQSVDEIAAQYGDPSRTLVTRVVREGLGDPTPFAFSSAEEFAKYVVDLRGNERDWSRRLGDTLLKAQEQVDAGNSVEAKGTLRDFRTTCPWRFLAEIAETQLQNMGG